MPRMGGDLRPTTRLDLLFRRVPVSSSGSPISRAFNTRRMTLPLSVLGREDMNTISRLPV